MKVTLLALVCLVLAGCATLPGADSSDANRATAAELANQLIGAYNNHAQIWYARQLGRANVAPAVRIEIQPIVGAEGGPIWLRFCHYRTAGPGEELVRQVRWDLRPGETPAAVVQSVYLRQNGDWRKLDGCEVYWRRTGSGFGGTTRGGGCRYREQTSHEVVVFQRGFKLGEGGLTYRFVRSGAGRSETTVLELAPIIVYTGWAGVRPKHADNSEKTAWRLDDDLRIHNQGGVVRLVDNQGVALDYAVKLEQLVWPDSKIPMLRLSIVDLNSDETLAYAWAEPDARRLGLNLGWLQVGLER